MKLIPRLMLNLMVLPLMGLFISSQVAASEDDLGVVKGHINYCGQGGIAGMRIYIPGRQFFVITGDDGKFVFDRIPVGQYELNYMLEGKVIKHKTAVYISNERENDVGEVALCDDPNYKAEAPAITNDKDSTPAASQVTTQESMQTPTAGSCNEGQLIKLPNGVGECKEGNIVVKSCDKKWSNCDGKADNGCETDIWTDPRNCGECENWCSNELMCIWGECT